MDNYLNDQRKHHHTYYIDQHHHQATMGYHFTKHRITMLYATVCRCFVFSHLTIESGTCGLLLKELWATTTSMLRMYQEDRYEKLHKHFSSTWDYVGSVFNPEYYARAAMRGLRMQSNYATIRTRRLLPMCWTIWSTRTMRVARRSVMRSTILSSRSAISSTTTPRAWSTSSFG